MPSASTTRPTVSPQTQERIYSPLYKLRGAIRRYIVLEALAFLFTFLVLLYWIGLGFDYLSFKLVGMDWVQIFPWWCRLALLLVLVLMLAIVLTLRLVRLFRSFQPDALALVLERRFPKLLGDRLITAVELSGDLDDAEACGYSRAMILETVREVSGQIDKIPLRAVFNWRRLWWQWAALAIVSVVFAVLGYVSDAVAHRSVNPINFSYRLADVSQIWFERNILLLDTLWPRRAYLELVDFPDNGELRIGRDAASPRIRVRALKWVQADRKAADGWRAVTWADLTPDLLGNKPVPKLPTTLLVAPTTMAPDAADPFWSVDRVEVLLDSTDVRDRLAQGGVTEPELAALREVFDALERKAADARMSRKLRKLRIPQNVVINYWGKKSSNEMPLTRQQDVNEFACVLADLKESVKFYVEGEDYVTYPYRRITLVPPPMINKLERDEEVPAYHFLRPPVDGSPEDLKGQKLVRTGIGVSLTGGTSKIDIPTGSNLVLRGEVDKDLQQFVLRYRSARNAPEGNAAPAELITEVHKIAENAPNKRLFENRFDNITRPIEFDYEFTDTDNVKSLRHIMIQPVEDRSPDVDVAVEIIRKTNQGYMCTPMAMIPFTGRVRDDSGLSKLDYAVTYARVESAAASALRAGIASGVLGATSPGPLPFELLTAPALADYLSRLSESREGAVTLPPMPLKTFEDVVTDRNRDPRFQYGKARLKELLLQPPPQDATIKAHEVKANLEFLDLLDRIPDLKKAGDNATIQPRFRLRLTIAATDTNVETGPRVGQNKETFTFLIVPYEELLGETAKDEEALAVKMRDLYDKLLDARAGVDKVVERGQGVMAGADEFRALASRMLEVEETVVKAHDVTQEVLNDCNRLLKELQTNRIPGNHVANKERICNRLDEAIRVLYPRAEEAHATMRKALEDRTPPLPPVIDASRKRHDELLANLKYTLDLMGEAEFIAKAARLLSDKIKAQEIIGEMIKALLQDEQDRILDEVAGKLNPKLTPVELAKGEKTIVTVEIGRFQLDGKLNVKLTAAPDSELVVPAMVRVAREGTQLQFELTAGNKAGEFAVTIVPMNIKNEPVKLEEPYDKKPLTLKVIVK